MKQTNLILIGIVALVIGAAAGFFGGMKYQESKSPVNMMGLTSDQRGPGGQRTFGLAGATRTVGARNGAVAGEILSVSDKSITVKLSDDTSKIILLTDTTTVNKSSVGSKTDLTTGTKIAVFGMTNSDGSVTAQRVQLNPMIGQGEMRIGNPVPDNTEVKQ